MAPEPADSSTPGVEIRRGARVGGIFGFQGLLADFSAMMFILQLYLSIRRRHLFVCIFMVMLMAMDPGRKLRLGAIPFTRGALVILHVQVVQFAFARLRDEHQRGNVYI